MSYPSSLVTSTVYILLMTMSIRDITGLFTLTISHIHVDFIKELNTILDDIVIPKYHVSDYIDCVENEKRDEHRHQDTSETDNEFIQLIINALIQLLIMNIFQIVMATAIFIYFETQTDTYSINNNYY